MCAFELLQYWYHDTWKKNGLLENSVIWTPHRWVLFLLCNKGEEVCWCFFVLTDKNCFLFQGNVPLCEVTFHITSHLLE